MLLCLAGRSHGGAYHPRRGRASAGRPARDLDLDGVIYRGGRAIDGAVDLVADLKASGVGVRFATNNSTVDRSAYVARLAALGIRATRDEVVTSTSATIEHLARHAPEVRRVLAVGERGIADELGAAGYEAVLAADAVPPAYRRGRPRPGLRRRRGRARYRVRLSAAGGSHQRRAGRGALRGDQRGPPLSDRRGLPARSRHDGGRDRSRQRRETRGHRKAGAGDVRHRARGQRGSTRGGRGGRRQPGGGHGGGPVGRGSRRSWF